jgi:imidazoleglycerol-phosphate dehydratase
MATTKKKGRKSAGKAAAVEAAGAAPRKARKTKGRSKPAAPARRSASSKRSSASAIAIRRAEVLRETSETRISVRLAIGEPGYRVETGVPFLDHMMEALSRHSGIGLAIEASGDTHIDDHHTVEDVGLAIGEALRRALGDKAGIYRFGHFEAPLDEALVAVTVDLSGRPYLVYNMGLKPQRVGTFDVGLVEDFFQALMTTAGMNLHINVRYGRNPHHIIEATFKAFAKALRMACAVDVATEGVPSTKGSLDG